MESLTNYLSEIALVIVTIPVTVSEKFYFVYLITFMALGYLSYRVYYRGGGD